MSIGAVFSLSKMLQKIDSERQIEVSRNGNEVIIVIPLKDEYKELRAIVVCNNEKIAEETRLQVYEGLKQIFPEE
jgi:hypothetical protein